MNFQFLKIFVETAGKLFKGPFCYAISLEHAFCTYDIDSYYSCSYLLCKYRCGILDL